jgi:MFS family permease
MRPNIVLQFVGICFAHWLSHVYLLVLPLLFPYLQGRLAASYLEIGLAVTVFSCVSAVTQTPIGFIIDRFGPRHILIAGIALGGIALVLLSQAVSYPMLLAVAALLGLANSVYHPANYAILSASIPEAWMGRAFSIHTFSGQLGTATAPLLMTFLIGQLAGIGAILAVGVLGLVVALALAFTPSGKDLSPPHRVENAQKGIVAMLLMPRLMMLTGFFMFLSLSFVGITNFGIVAFNSGYGMSVSAATLTLSVYLSLSAIGVLAGGLLADRMGRHGLVLVVCFGLNAVLVAIVSVAPRSVELIVALMALGGFFGGLIAPSRDMLVRKLAPPGTIGRVFGLVTTGLTLGGMIGPIIFGTVMDLGLPRWVFALSALAMIVALAFSVGAERRATNDARDGTPA